MDAVVINMSLKEWRERMKLTKIGAAHAVGVSPNSWSLYEARQESEGSAPPRYIRLACSALLANLPLLRS